MRRAMLGGVLSALLAVAIPAEAPAQGQPVRVRGAIAQMDGTTIAVNTREGDAATLRLPEKLLVSAVAPLKPTDIQPGAFVGVTAVPQSEGPWRALEVHVFPESMRGTGEGQRPYDLAPESTMTNAAVAETVTRVEGPTLVLKYKGGEKAVLVSPETPVVAYIPGDRSDVKIGAKIVASANRMPDGSLEVSRLVVSRNGTDPPM